MLGKEYQFVFLIIEQSKLSPFGHPHLLRHSISEVLPSPAVTRNLDIEIVLELCHEFTVTDLRRLLA